MAKVPAKPSTRVRRDLGAELLQSVREMKAGVRAREHRPQLPHVVRARLSTGFSQSQFAELLGVSLRTLQDWEQGRREPSGAAKTLLRVAERHPKILQELEA